MKHTSKEINPEFKTQADTSQWSKRDTSDPQKDLRLPNFLEFSHRPLMVTRLLELRFYKSFQQPIQLMA